MNLNLTVRVNKLQAGNGNKNSILVHLAHSTNVQHLTETHQREGCFSEIADGYCYRLTMKIPIIMDAECLINESHYLHKDGCIYNFEEQDHKLVSKNESLRVLNNSCISCVHYMRCSMTIKNPVTCRLGTVITDPDDLCANCEDEDCLAWLPF